MRRLYTLVGLLVAPFAFALVLWRAVRDPAYREGWRERWGFGADGPAESSIWVHAVSMGEVGAAAPLVGALLAAHPQTPLVLTTATPAGSKRARELFGGAVDVRFVPYDLPCAARRLFARIRPKIAIFMETELWPNLYRECRRRGVPIVIANARISGRSWPRYRRLRALTRPMLERGVTIAAQTDGDAERFLYLGADAGAVHVTGNLKFDIQIEAHVLQRGRSLRETHMRGRRIWVAGSTHPGEEEILLDAHALIRAAIPSAMLILVPRHAGRFDAVAALLGRRGIDFSRRSAIEGVSPQTEVLLLDTVGELMTFYAIASAAFVGGSLVPAGGHNLIEPAALAIPLATGPFNANSPDVAQLLIDRRAVVIVRSAPELAAALSVWLADEGAAARGGALARGVVESNRGALRRLLALVAALIDSKPPVP